MLALLFYTNKLVVLIWFWFKNVGDFSIVLSWIVWGFYVIQYHNSQWEHKVLCSEMGLWYNHIIFIT